MQERRLAAIMFTDIVGYTALMGSDEDRAFETLRKNREIHTKYIERFNGNQIKEMGDGMLISFDLASEAVRCAIEIQKACKTENIPLKIGIHEGEMVFEGTDVFGDGVNIASRIQEAAEAGCILVSGAVYRDIKNKADIHTDFAEEKHFKNVDEKISIYQVIVSKERNPDHQNRGPITIQQKTSGRKMWTIPILVLVTVILSVALFFYVDISKHDESPLSVTSEKFEKSIAVLPFVNMSGDPGYEYFSDGISEEILNTLTNIPQLKVAGRTSSFMYKNSQSGISEIGEELNVNLILEGSVRKSHNMLRVTAQLINVSDGYHIWSDEYDRELSDIFRIQESIARNIARKLNLAISESGERHFELYADKEFEPFELSLKGRSLLQQRIEGIEEAKKCFEKAIALDPEYAPAYADLSITYYWMGIFYFIPPDEAFPLSVVYAKKALRLDPGLTDAHKFIAWSLLYFNWDWATARTEYNKIKVNNNAKDHFFYSIYQAFILEDFDSAVKLAEEILDRDPKSIRSKLNLAFIYLTGRNFEEAQIILNDIIGQYPYISEAHRYLGLIHFFQANYDNAVESLNRAINIAEGKGSAPYYLLCAKAAQRELDENSSIFEQYMVNTPQWYCPARKAMVFMYMGKPDRAFEWMNRAFDHKDYILTSLKVSPDWDAFRNDARFDSLLVKMNLFKEPDL